MPKPIVFFLVADLANLESKNVAAIIKQIAKKEVALGFISDQYLMRDVIWEQIKRLCRLELTAKEIYILNKLYFDAHAVPADKINYFLHENPDNYDRVIVVSNDDETLFTASKYGYETVNSLFNLEAVLKVIESPNKTRLDLKPTFKKIEESSPLLVQEAKPARSTFREKRVSFVLPRGSTDLSVKPAMQSRLRHAVSMLDEEVKTEDGIAVQPLTFSQPLQSTSPLKKDEKKKKVRNKTRSIRKARAEGKTRPQHVPKAELKF